MEEKGRYNISKYWEAIRVVEFLCEDKRIAKLLNISKEKITQSIYLKDEEFSNDLLFRLYFVAQTILDNLNSGVYIHSTAKKFKNACVNEYRKRIS